MSSENDHHTKNSGNKSLKIMIALFQHVIRVMNSIKKSEFLKIMKQTLTNDPILLCNLLMRSYYMILTFILYTEI